MHYNISFQNMVFSMTFSPSENRRSNILGIVCSPRKNGNTEIMVREALMGAEEDGAESELLHVADMKMEPCDGCRACREHGICHIKDDVQTIHRKMFDADGIIIGSPVYFYAVSAQAKIIMDRSYALRWRDGGLNPRLKGKSGGAVAVAARRGCFSALQTINTFFLAVRMWPVSLGVEGYAREKGEIKNDIETLRAARRLGKEVVESVGFRKDKA
jgi:multimeric flavodoxin WrbA